MPVAAVAEGVKAAYHSHTPVAGQRDDYRRVRQKGPGSALGISTGDPAYRFEKVGLNCPTGCETMS
jgi:hypothetical protein